MTGKQIVSLTREYEGTMVPTPGIYDIDPKHTTAEFVARHLMITKVRGRLDDVSGTIHIAEVPEGSSVEVTIDAKRVHTGEEQRDAHLRSADFFDVEEHPTWTFKSTAVEHVRDNLWKVTGDLTIRGTTRPVVLETEFDGAGPTPWGPSALAFSAVTEIDREDWGLTWNAALETGGVVVGRKVRIELNVEALARQHEDSLAS
jgi:polyisoprenoid-binding protein YceI